MLDSNACMRGALLQSVDCKDGGPMPKPPARDKVETTRRSNGDDAPRLYLLRALPKRPGLFMKALLQLADTIAPRLIARRETIAIAESSTGGLIAAALLAVPGASAYFLGGAVVYTKSSRAALLGIGDAEMQGLRPATEAYALLMARRVRERHGATWGIGETGATGPSGNRYGDPAGHTCIAVAGPAERAITLRTGYAERLANMDAFAKRALELLVEVIPRT
jgi:nicotinamide-nucleotide amidase